MKVKRENICVEFDEPPKIESRKDAIDILDLEAVESLGGTITSIGVVDFPNMLRINTKKDELDLLDVLSDDDLSKLFELCVMYRYGGKNREKAWLIKEEWERLKEKLAADYAAPCKAPQIIPFPVRRIGQYSGSA